MSVELQPIGELLETIIDYRGKTPPQSDSGIPCISAANIKGGRICLEKVKYVSQDTYDGWTTRGLPEEGDVIITTEAPVGEVAEYPGDKTYLLTRRVIALRAKKEKLHNRYLKFALQTPFIINRLLEAARGSTVPRVLKTDITNLGIPLPAVDDQKRIAHILGTLDDKIELNRQMNKTLEAMAQAIFKSWFVDFDPVHAKANAIAKGQDSEAVIQAAMEAIAGSNPEINSTLGADPEKLRHIASLFPSEFVESELGLIPKGWEVSTVEKYINLTKGRSYKSSELKESNTALVTLKSFMRGGGYREDGLKEYVGKYKPEQTIEPGELVMSLTDVTQNAEIVGKPAIVSKNNSYEKLVASLDVAIIRTTGKYNKEFFYGLMSTYRFHRYAESFATGTTVLHLKTKGITSFEFSEPDKRLSDSYTEIHRNILLKVQDNNIEVKTLSKLRDTLLPKLLSGELSVENAEPELELV
jgi:type I restriction enzyme, S subunit